MSLIVESFTKKISRKKKLELDFEFLNYKNLLILDEDKENLDVISKIFYSNTKYDGNIFLFNKNIKKEKDYFYYSDEQFGFYNHLTAYENLLKILKLFKIKIDKKYILDLLDLAKIENLKYGKLDDNSKSRLKLLFKHMVSENLLIVDIYKHNDIEKYKEYYDFIINDNSKNRINIILSENINKIVSGCDKILVLSDNKQVYYGDIENLSVVKDLIIIEISDFNENQLSNSIKIDHKLVDNKLVLRKSDMEVALYHLLSNDINVLNISDFNKNTNIYDNKE